MNLVQVLVLLFLDSNYRQTNDVVCLCVVNDFFFNFRPEVKIIKSEKSVLL